MVPPEYCCAVGVRTTEQADAEMAGGHRIHAFGYVLIAVLYVVPESLLFIFISLLPRPYINENKQRARANTRGQKGDLEAQIETQKRAQRRQKRGGREATVDHGKIGTCSATYYQWSFRYRDRYFATLLQWWNYTDCTTYNRKNIGQYLQQHQQYS